MKKYIQFLDNFRKNFSTAIDAIIEYGMLENREYLEIFHLYDKDNKEKFNHILDLIFNFDIDYSYINDLINKEELFLDKIDKDLNKVIFNEIANKRDHLIGADNQYYTSSPFADILDNLGVFAFNNYFTLEDGVIGVRNLIVTPENCVKKESDLRKQSFRNFNAIMDKNGNIYLAIGYHNDLMLYLMANSIDLRGGIRIADELVNNMPVFELSSLYKYFRFYTESSEFEKDKCLYLSKSKIRKICEYLMSAKPNIAQKTLADMFLNADGFGYDFISYSNSNNVNVDYFLAIENLQNVMDVLEEFYPDEVLIDLVGMCKERFKEFNYGLIE